MTRSTQKDRTRFCGEQIRKEKKKKKPMRCSCPNARAVALLFRGKIVLLIRMFGLMQPRHGGIRSNLFRLLQCAVFGGICPILSEPAGCCCSALAWPGVRAPLSSEEASGKTNKKRSLLYTWYVVINNTVLCTSIYIFFHRKSRAYTPPYCSSFLGGP